MYKSLSVDGGATKTDLLLVNTEENGGYFHSGKGTNPNVYGEDGIHRLMDLMNEICTHARIENSHIEWAVLGISGIGRPSHKLLLNENLNKHFPKTKIDLMNDAEMCHALHFGTSPGMTLIAGTGSIAVGRDEDGQLKRAGGHGFQVGDEGSGYWLGKRLITELIAAERSNAEDIVDLKKKIMDYSGQSDFEQFVRFISEDMESVVKLAGLSPVIFDEAEKGNLLASHLVNQGAEALAELIEDLAQKLNMNDSVSQIGIGGSVITKSDYYQELVRGNLLYSMGEIAWMRSEYPPVYGGIAAVDESISLGELEIENV
jgi:N-acetylglucosamine kinase-like BadF-type ATPase|tara:strand:+ start:3020 stop:3967 length:948 start_codon:yes stop_codon:yes gene_type:complete